MEEMETETINLDTSDTEDSESNDEQEELLNSRAEVLEQQLSDNKYLYDVHLELVEIYRKLGDLRSMRLAYERFHEYFPLTAQIWLAWISDEKKLADSDSDKQHVLELFSIAVEDYLSVELWQEYAQYSIGAANLEATREIIEKGLQAVGLHTGQGILLWDTYRELELAHLSLTPVDDSKAYQTQLDRVVNIFKRQLSIPLIGMENTYSEWNEWLQSLPDNKIDPKPVEWGYKKASKLLEVFRPFEDKLLSKNLNDSEILDIFRDYVKVIEDPSTKKCVYERATAQLCLNPSIWEDYCTYALKFGELADEVSTKSLRNCPWSENLWIFRLRILELLGRTETEVLKCFEDSLKSLLGQNCLEIWLTYLEFCKRNFTDEEKVLRQFQLAISQLGYKLDPFGKVPKWYARILAKKGDIIQARKLWKGIMKSGENKGVSSFWLEQIRLEKQYGDEKSHLRNLYERALSNVTDWPQVIAEDWLSYERDEGDLESVLKCAEKSKDILKIHEKKSEVVEKPRPPKRQLKEETIIDNKKPKFDFKTPIEKNPAKTVFVSNLYPSIGEKKLKKFFPDSEKIEIVVDKLGKSRCYGYVQFKMEEEVMVALSRDRELLEGRPVFISVCKPDRTERQATFKYSNQIEANKLFVRGLPIDKTKEDVWQLFEQWKVKDVRLVLRKNGKPKGLAYVEFEDEENAKMALKATDGMTVGDFKITVAVSAPPVKAAVKKTEATTVAPSRHSKSRLQVPLIPRTLQVNKNQNTNGNEPSASGSKSNDDFRKMLGI